VRTGLKAIGDATGEAERAVEAAEQARERLRSVVDAARRSRRGKTTGGTRTLGQWLGTDRRRWGTLVGWVLGAAVEQVARDSGEHRGGVFDAWQVAGTLVGALREVGLDEAGSWRSIEISRALVTLPDNALSSVRGTGAGALRVLVPWFELAEVRAASDWHVWEDASWVTQEPWEEMLAALAARDFVAGDARAFERASRLRQAVTRAGFQVGHADGDPARDQS
jgi:hypothetical protein